MAAPTNGTIKRLVSEKGFGFVAASDGSEYFFHQSFYIKLLNIEDEVL